VVGLLVELTLKKLEISVALIVPALVIAVALAAATAVSTNLQVKWPGDNPYVFAGTNGVNGTLSVSGTGVATIAPDRAKLSIGLFTEGFTAKEAVDKNAVIFDDILRALEEQGVSRDDITTSWYTIYPIYEYAGSRPVLVSYKVEHQISVVVFEQNLDSLGRKVGRVIDAAVGAGANQMYGMQFTVSDEKVRELKDQALASAVRDAARKAQLMAEALQVTIKGVISISESGGYWPPVPIYRSYTESAGTQVLPQMFEVTASVSVVYAIV
jgi:uncharacterized protein YggE